MKNKAENVSFKKRTVELGYDTEMTKKFDREVSSRIDPAEMKKKTHVFRFAREIIVQW